MDILHYIVNIISMFKRKYNIMLGCRADENTGENAEYIGQSAVITKHLFVIIALCQTLMQFMFKSKAYYVAYIRISSCQR